MMASLFDNFLKPTSLKPSSVFSEETMYEENISKRILKSVELVPFQLSEEFKKNKNQSIFMKPHSFQTVESKLTEHKL